jgi:hypothetical protein
MLSATSMLSFVSSASAPRRVVPDGTGGATLAVSETIDDDGADGGRDACDVPAAANVPSRAKKAAEKAIKDRLMILLGDICPSPSL